MFKLKKILAGVIFASAISQGSRKSVFQRSYPSTENPPFQAGSSADGRAALSLLSYLLSPSATESRAVIPALETPPSAWGPLCRTDVIGVNKNPSLSKPCGFTKANCLVQNVDQNA